MAIYFIEAASSHAVKIGFASNISLRFRTLQNATWESLAIIRTIEGAREAEGWLHAHFLHLHLAREWFRFDPAMLTIEPDLAVKKALPRKLGHEDAMPYALREFHNRPRGCHGDILRALGGKAVVARALGLGPQVVTKWHSRGIPPQYWHHITEMAALQIPPMALTVSQLEQLKAAA